MPVYVFLCGAAVIYFELFLLFLVFFVGNRHFSHSYKVEAEKSGVALFPSSMAATIKKIF